MRRTLTFCLMLVTAFISLFAESPQLKSVTMTMEPMTTTMQRLDANGQVCGLVKVIVPGKNIVFEGNLVGNSEYKTSEYWCYLSPNTRYLKIKYPDLEPLMVDFNEFFINGIQSKRIYEIVLTIPNNSTRKIGTPIELTVSSYRSVPFWGMDDHSQWGFKKNPSWRIGNDTIGQVNVYVNLKNGKYDEQLVTTTSKPSLIGNVVEGDILTFIPQNSSFAELQVAVNDTVIKKQHLSVKIKKKKRSLRGLVYDKTNEKPIEDALTKLYYLNTSDDYLYWAQSYGDTLCTSKTKRDGSFGYNNCVSDYTYYLEVKAPAGYNSRYVTNGINIKPIESDSLIIYLSPNCIAGIVTDGKKPIKGAEIYYDGLYNSQTATQEDGSFNIVGNRADIITITALGYRTLKLDISDCKFRFSRGPEWDKAHNWGSPIPLKIKLQKGDSAIVENGVYESPKDKIRKLK